MAELVFRIDVADPTLREVEVTLEIPANAFAAEGERVLFLPTWTPGSYLIREYSRHLGPVELLDADGVPIARCLKVSKNRFRIGASHGEPIRLRYRVYAHELSVRTAHIDDRHAYWNHACLLLWPVDRPDCSARIMVDLPADWSHACALTQVAADPAPTPACQRIALQAHDLDEVVDSPFLAGHLHRLDWSILGTAHTVVLDGLEGVPVPATLQRDFAAIVQSAAAVFGGTLPYQRYLFQCLFTDRGHGGLEHAESTTLLMSRTALHDRKGYLEFLSLAAHELFHAWNVKRMRPAELWRFDYENENYTRLLWLMEGWTAYFDDLLTLRAGLSIREEYLAALAGNIDRMRAGQGRFVLSLEESGFDAWIRLYRPDENTRNSSQNYYGNGAVAAACLDLTIRKISNGARSLDDVIRTIYHRTYEVGRGYRRADVDDVLREIAGEEAVATLANLVDGVLDPDLESVFAAVGIAVVAEGAGAPFLGITFESGGTVVASVQREAPAHLAGIAPGDEVLALQGLRVTSGNWREVLTSAGRVGEPLAVLHSRRGVIAERVAQPTPSPGTIRLVPKADASAEQIAMRNGWLKN